MNGGTQVGTVELIATIDTSQYKQGAREIDNANKGIQDSASSTEKQGNNAFNSIAKVGIGGLIAATVAVSAAIVGNIGGAIKRVDTLNNSSRVFEQMGFQAADADAAIATLTKSIQGLPTPLDAAVRSTTALAATYGDISLGQKVFTALNNAIIGFGGSANEVENAITQLSQLPLDGPLDAQTWNSLRNSGLTPVLVALSKDFGMSIGDLREAFGKGELTVQDFVNALIRLNTEGGGGLQSLESIAKSATSGISTGFANMQTAITRGLATIIEAVGSANIASAISTIGTAFESALKNVAGFIKFIIANKDVFGPIATGITAIVTAITAWVVATKALTIAQAAFDGVLKASAIGKIIVIILGVVSALIYFFTQTQLGKDIVVNVFKFIEDSIRVLGEVINNLGNFFKDTWNNIKTIWEPVGAFFKIIGDIISIAFAKPLADIKKNFETLFNSIKIIAEPVINFLVQAWDTIAKAVAPAIQQIQTAIAPFIGAIQTLVGQVINWIRNNETLLNILKVIGGIILAVLVAPLAILVIAIGAVITAFIGIALAVTFVVSKLLEFVNFVGQIVAQVLGFFLSLWNGIVSIFTPIVGFFANIFTSAWQAITSAFGSVATWFRDNVWNPIVSLFTNIGTTIGNAMGNAFKSIVNSVLRFAVNTINTFIDAINGAIDLVNRIPGVNLGKVGKLPIPQLAEGGIVSKATLAVIGEGSEPEAVIPLSKLDKMISSEGGGKTEYNIGTINIANEVDGEKWLQKLTNNQEIVSSNLVPTQKYMGA